MENFIQSVTRKPSTKRSKNFLTRHFERSEKSSASKKLRMHKISPYGRNDKGVVEMTMVLVPAMPG
uniref:Uncharacterized protein n=1 Tax=Candidatus Kentrum sp. LFY TaxID=2126342 RepID=A0A450WHB9_9GAMM|nr:MAG: hypothetical protein BECKLFY1418C_GA0070996_102331 [Candidatus Kentron sp. LFY]